MTKKESTEKNALDTVRKPYLDSHTKPVNGFTVGRMYINANDESHTRSSILRSQS